MAYHVCTHDHACILYMLENDIYMEDNNECYTSTQEVPIFSYKNTHIIIAWYRSTVMNRIYTKVKCIYILLEV